ncbi:MAG: malectin [Limisphaerales bacterium]
MKFWLQQPCLFSLLMLMLLLPAGCESNQVSPAAQAVKTTSSSAVTTAAPVTTTKVAPKAVRIKAGSSAPFTDSQGNVWLADQGFNGGDVIERPDLVITNTAEPEIDRSEHYSMDSFSWPLPNGNYLTKLHFCETFEGITGPGQRIFTFNVQGHDFKDFDVWTKAGGPLTAYVETVPVEIKDGRLLITFTGNVENPQINGIEIIPQP